MPEGALFGGSVMAALVAGGIALFAPCCIGVMLPAYLAAAFQNQRRRVAMTFLFGAGIATVILPIALGAAALVRLISVGHLPLYLAGGVLMAGLGRGRSARAVIGASRLRVAISALPHAESLTVRGRTMRRV